MTAEPLVADLAIDRYCGVPALGRPAIGRGELRETLRDLGGVSTETPAMVAVPSHGLGELRLGETGAFQAIARGAAELYVGVRAEVELCGSAWYSRSIENFTCGKLAG
jgi:hypothetical protein